MAKLLVVQSKLNNAVKAASLQQGAKVNNVAGDFAPALDKALHQLIETAVARAKANGRRTVMGKDV